MIKHRIKCFDSEILVCQQENASYDLTIQSSSNPLGFGQQLESFATQDSAVQAAEQFCRMYTAAREKGYHYKDKGFAKPDRQRIEIHPYLSAAKPEERFYSEL